MSKVKYPQKDLYGNPISSSSSGGSMDISYTLDIDESPSNIVSKVSSNKSTNTSIKEVPVKDITKSNVWTTIFGDKISKYGNKRGIKKRLSSYSNDITLLNFTNAALSSFVLVIAPIIQKKFVHQKVFTMTLSYFSCFYIHYSLH